MPKPVIEVIGVESLQALARDLKAAGNKELSRELRRGIQRAAKPLKAGAKEAALEELPKSGGLAERVASSKFSTTTRLGTRNPSIRIVGRGNESTSGGGQLDLNSLDRGRIRHLVYGHRPWQNQVIQPLWFSHKMETIADTTVRADIMKVIETVADKLGGSR